MKPVFPKNIPFKSFLQKVMNEKQLWKPTTLATLSLPYPLLTGCHTLEEYQASEQEGLSMMI